MVKSCHLIGSISQRKYINVFMGVSPAEGYYDAAGMRPLFILKQVFIINKKKKHICVYV